MRTISILTFCATALLTVNMNAAAPKGGSSRSEEHRASKIAASQVAPAHSCEHCDAMSESDTAALRVCQEGKELGCPTCKTTTVTHRLDKARPQPKGKTARSSVVAFQHGEKCVIAAKAAFRSDRS